MKASPRIAKALGFAALLVASVDVYAQRSIKVDDGNWSDNSCDQAGLIGSVSGNDLILGLYTLEGYQPVWDAGTGDFTYCEEVVGKGATSYYDVESVLTGIFATNETASARRYAFITESNIFGLNNASSSTETDQFGFQWEVFYFTDAIIAALRGPTKFSVNAGGTIDQIALNSGVTASDTFLRVTGGSTLVSGVDVTTGYLCFNADATQFNGLKTADQLASCRGNGGGGTDGGTGGGGGNQVPLPGTLGLLGIGLAGLGLIRRRR